CQAEFFWTSHFDRRMVKSNGRIHVIRQTTMKGDMRTFPTTVLLLIAVIALCFVNSGCSRSAPEQSAVTSIRVTDRATEQPIIGAIISTLCMGGTPYATNTYHTDAQGFASVLYPYHGQSSFMVVLIKKEGYENGSVAVPFPNQVVSLKRLQH